MKVIAHRGLSALYPENTLLAFEVAVKNGATTIECDVQLTRDNVPVLFHDDVLIRITGQSGRIADYSYEELLGQDFGAWFAPEFRNTKICALRDLLQTEAPTELFLELKRTPQDTDLSMQHLADACLWTVKQISHSHNIYFISFDDGVLEYLLRQTSDYKYGLNIEKTVTEDQWNRSSLYDYIGFDISQVTAQDIKKAKTMGLSVGCYTCNREAEILKAYEMGAYMVMTDNLVYTREVLKAVNSV